jgi:ribosomal protein L7Ae-like RNA K-turn-binding protein
MKDWKRSLQLENKSNQRLYGMLGFAMRAGKVIIGTELVCRAMPTGRVKLVLVSSAASEATRKKLFVKSDYYSISAIEVDVDTERLGNLLGKSYAPAAVAVTDDGFAEEIKKATVSN